MKKLFFSLLLVMTSIPAFAQVDTSKYEISFGARNYLSEVTNKFNYQGIEPGNIRASMVELLTPPIPAVLKDWKVEIYYEADISDSSSGTTEYDSTSSYLIIHNAGLDTIFYNHTGDSDDGGMPILPNGSRNVLPINAAETPIYFYRKNNSLYTHLVIERGIY